MAFTLWLLDKSHFYGSSPPMFQDTSSETLQTIRIILADADR